MFVCVSVYRFWIYERGVIAGCVCVCAPGRFVSVSSRRAGGGRQKMRTRHAGGMCITCQGGGGGEGEGEGGERVEHLWLQMCSCECQSLA